MHIIFETNATPKKVIDGDNAGIENTKEEEPKNLDLASRPFELLHIDLFGPMNVISLSSKTYGFVIVDDFSRFTWVYFLAHKDDALHTFIKHYKKVQNEKCLTLVNIKSDHGGKFENYDFEMFCFE